MIGKYFYSVRRRIREFFLLEEARLRYEALTDSRRRDLRFYHHAGIGRLRSARDVRGLNQLIPSLVLYRQAGLFFALAFLLSKNENPDTGRLTPDTIVDLLDSSLATHPLLALLVAAGIRGFSPRNIALHKAVTSSSRAYDTVPEGALNGERKWQFDFHSGLEDWPWLAIDLGRRYSITRIRVYGRSDTAFDQSIPLALEVSDDGVSYRRIAHRSEPFSDFDPWIVKPAAVVTRFLRLRTLRRSVLVLNEVEVNGQPVR